MTKQDSVLAQVAALKTMPAPELRKQWQKLFDTPPPRYNRRFLESRLAGGVPDRQQPSGCRC